MSPGALWPRSDETGEGPYASAEPPMGTPYQFYHGPADTGNWRDGYNPGRAGRSVKSVYVDGVEAQPGDMTKDDAFGIVWLKRAACEVAGRAGNPETIRLRWTAVDQSFTSGDAWLGAGRLTAKYPHGYNADAAPCILGDFAVPASGGGAPASSKLGLVNSPRYPAPGARVASVRFVMRYTGVETSPGNFNLRIFDREYSFASSELADGAGIEADGWTVSMDQKGTEFEIWPGNEGYPYTETSPDPRQWYVYELSRDVTADAKSHLDAFNGFADTFRAWFSGTVWPSTNSVIALGCYLEVSFDPVEAVIEGPEVTAVVGGPPTTAGEILGEVIPAEFVGSGFDDASLPQLKYHVDRPQTVCAFVRQVTRDSGTELLMNYDTGKYDLAPRSAVRDSGNPPPGAGGVADISQGDMLAGETGLPMISRARSAPENVANEITVEYTSAEGRKESVTARNEGSIATHGLRKKKVVMGAGVGRAEAEARAREVLGELSEPGDYYTMVFPLGPALALEPNDVLTVTADMDALNGVLMRVVSVEVAPGALADGEIATVTVNARRYDKARRGFGETSFGSGPFGAGEVMEN